MRYWLSHCVRSPPRGSLLLLCSCQVHAIINPDNGPAAHGTHSTDHEYLPCLLYLDARLYVLYCVRPLYPAQS